MKRINKILKHQLLISLVILNTVIFILFSPNHYFFEMLQSMAFQITLTIYFIAFVFLIFKKWIGMSISLLAILLINFNISYFSFGKSEYYTVAKVDLSIAHYNVLKFNENYQKTINSILENDADFVSINEMTYEWSEALKEGLEKKYSYHYLVPQHNSFGIGFFSKNEILNPETIWFQGIPYIAANLQINDTVIKLLGAHTIPPTNKYAFAKRNNEIKSIENYLSNVKDAVIIVGDFNAVSWSSAMTELRNNLALKDSRKHFEPTYPAWNKLLMIPIDHIFHSQQITCVSFETISDTDSDHYGILGRYKI